MLWFSAGVLFVLTLCAWRTAGYLKEDGESATLRRVCLLAALAGAAGTLCFIAAALI
jgi:hypothetical protein